MKTTSKALMAALAIATVSFASASTAYASNAESATSMATSIEATAEASAESSSSSIYEVEVYDDVKANTTDIYRIHLRAGETFYIHVVGDGDTDLDLYVYDENDNLVASDTDYTDNCRCVVTPRWSGQFKIKIVNRGNVYNHYHYWVL